MGSETIPEGPLPLKKGSRGLYKGRVITPKSRKSLRAIDMVPTLTHTLESHLFRSPESPLDLVFCNKAGKPATLV